MSPFEQTPAPADQELPFANSPMDIVHDYLDRSPLPPPRVLERSIDSVAETVWYSYYHDEHKDAMEICLDLASRTNKSSLILAEMFKRNHVGLPDRWKSNPEIMRSVLSMSAYAELGRTQALRIYLNSHGDDTDYLDENVSGLTGFVEELQAK